MASRRAHRQAGRGVQLMLLACALPLLCSAVRSPFDVASGAAGRQLLQTFGSFNNGCGVCSTAACRNGECSCIVAHSLTCTAGPVHGQYCCCS